MMKHAHNSITVLFLLTILGLSNAYASGAKLPEVADPSAGTMADTANSPPTGPNDGSTTTPPTSGSTTISDSYSHLDPDHIVPKALLAKALQYFDEKAASVKNKEVIGVIDFSQRSSKERFYIIDMQSGRVETYLVAHGKNSDPDRDGFATQFSNTPGSEMSSQGIYVTAETYEGSHGYSLKLDGKSSTNSNARSRAIVIHPADYVQPGGDIIGRSWGCPALDPRFSQEVIDKIKGGAVIYAQ